MPVTHCTGVSEGVTAPGSVGEKVLGTPRAALCFWGWKPRRAEGGIQECSWQVPRSPTLTAVPVPGLGIAHLLFQDAKEALQGGQAEVGALESVCPCRVTSTRGSWDRDIPILMLSGRVGCSAPVPGRAPGWNAGGH